MVVFLGSSWQHRWQPRSGSIAHSDLRLALHTDEELLHAAHTQGMQLADLVHAAGVQEVAGKGICDCCALVSSGQVCSV